MVSDPCARSDATLRLMVTMAPSTVDVPFTWYDPACFTAARAFVSNCAAVAAVEVGDGLAGLAGLAADEPPASGVAGAVLVSFGGGTGVTAAPVAGCGPTPS